MTNEEVIERVRLAKMEKRRKKTKHKGRGSEKRESDKVSNNKQKQETKNTGKPTCQKKYNKRTGQEQQKKP